MSDQHPCISSIAILLKCLVQVSVAMPSRGSSNNCQEQLQQSKLQLGRGKSMCLGAQLKSSWNINGPPDTLPCPTKEQVPLRCWLTHSTGSSPSKKTSTPILMSCWRYFTLVECAQQRSLRLTFKKISQAARSSSGSCQARVPTVSATPFTCKHPLTPLTQTAFSL